MSVQSTAQVSNNPLPHIPHKITMSKCGYAANQENNENRHNDQIQHVQILIGEFLIHHIFDYPGEDKVGACYKQHADYGNKQYFPVGPQIAQQPFIAAQFILFLFYGHSFPILAVFKINSPVRRTAPLSPSLLRTSFSS